MLHLYLFYDDEEETLVSAESKDDALDVIEERWGGDAAACCRLLSFCFRFPDNFYFNCLKNDAGSVACKRRGVVAHKSPGCFTKYINKI